MADVAAENEEERQNWHWRNSMRTVRFFNLDARAAFPFFFLLFYARLSMLLITLAVTIVFYVLERKGLTFPAAMRALRVWIVGVHRPALLSIRRKRLHDYG
jgi:intracellular multiplication protein IcmT